MKKRTYLGSLALALLLVFCTTVSFAAEVEKLVPLRPASPAEVPVPKALEKSSSDFLGAQAKEGNTAIEVVAGVSSGQKSDPNAVPKSQAIGDLNASANSNPNGISIPNEQTPAVKAYKAATTGLGKGNGAGWNPNDFEKKGTTSRFERAMMLYWLEVNAPHLLKPYGDDLKGYKGDGNQNEALVKLLENPEAQEVLSNTDYNGAKKAFQNYLDNNSGKTAEELAKLAEQGQAGAMAFRMVQAPPKVDVTVNSGLSLPDITWGLVLFFTLIAAVLFLFIGYILGLGRGKNQNALAGDLSRALGDAQAEKDKNRDKDDQINFWKNEAENWRKQFEGEQAHHGNTKERLGRADEERAAAVTEAARLDKLNFGLTTTVDRITEAQRVYCEGASSLDTVLTSALGAARVMENLFVKNK